MEVIIYNKYWTVDYVRKNDQYLFIYGDNDVGKGHGGQAVIRDEPNTIGIPTKKSPSRAWKAYYYDTEYDENVNKINQAFEKAKNKSQKYLGVVLPGDGFGTGLANLSKTAPRTLEYINKRTMEFIEELT
tara:strand:- start:686 stop:1075 length:390 start_codon:yes stop_codon:yes gene_type:complete